MIVTEEEAKTKRCQESFGQHYTTTDGRSAMSMMGAGSSYAILASPSFCIGSFCMAWRWHNDDLSDYPPNTKGFCGKAGP